MIFDHSDKLIYNSEDHKVTNPKEKRRIEEAGGYVSYGRISQPKSYGGLAVARAFGDFQYKKLNDSDKNPASVSATPDVQGFESSNVKGILIMCDGVTDVLDDNSILEYYTSRENDEALASELVMGAFEKGSLDNISACFIRAPKPSIT